MCHPSLLRSGPRRSGPPARRRAAPRAPPRRRPPAAASPPRRGPSRPAAPPGAARRRGPARARPPRGRPGPCSCGTRRPARTGSGPSKAADSRGSRRAARRQSPAAASHRSPGPNRPARVPQRGCLPTRGLGHAQGDRPGSWSAARRLHAALGSGPSWSSARVPCLRLQRAVSPREFPARRSWSRKLRSHRASDGQVGPSLQMPGQSPPKPGPQKRHRSL
mmetsp:Transcript_41132/g.118865  ORF Transcript_41132/g.118865 Transcript_41132/m.118865 type:complete len:220 (-) Transcript_41132:435-1094(-)